jgi:hypothetical protein
MSIRSSNADEPNKREARLRTEEALVDGIAERTAVIRGSAASTRDS